MSAYDDLDDDDDLPRGFTDADLEQTEWEARGAAVSRARRAGRCTHGSVVEGLPSGKAFYPEQVGLAPGQMRCRDCGRLFQDNREWQAAMDEAVG